MITSKCFLVRYLRICGYAGFSAFLARSSETGRRSARMDVLSDVLNAVHLTGAIFFERHLHAPWVGKSPHSAAIASTVMPEAEHVISFHAILSGSCWAALVGSTDSGTRFNAGDIVIYPIGDANVLSSAPGHAWHSRPRSNTARPKDRPLPIVTHLNNDGADYCHLVCGYFGCDARPFNPLLEALPRMLISQMSAAGTELVVQHASPRSRRGRTRRRRQRKFAGQACRADVH